MTGRSDGLRTKKGARSELSKTDPLQVFPAVEAFESFVAVALERRDFVVSGGVKFRVKLPTNRYRPDHVQLRLYAGRFSGHTGPAAELSLAYECASRPLSRPCRSARPQPDSRRARWDMPRTWGFVQNVPGAGCPSASP
jgi:hypothetical protein